MLYFTIPSSETELFRICGLNPTESGRKLKRSADIIQALPSAVKQPKSDGFSVKLDVIHFEPEEIAIKVVGNDLVVTGKHGERLDENGSISRQFTRRYQLPKDIDLEKMTSKLSFDGKLMIEAPLIQKEVPNGRVIPITIVGQKSLNKGTDETEDQKREQIVNGA